MEQVKQEVLEALDKIKKVEEHLEVRSPREVRDDFRADRGDALLDRMDSIAEKLGEKLSSMAITLTAVDVRLNNHLKHHEKTEDSLKKVLYPVAVAIILGMGALVWNIIRTHL